MVNKFLMRGCSTISIFVCIVFLTGCQSYITTSQTKQTTKITSMKKEKKICVTYKNKMSYASSYIINEFNEGYFNSNDLVGVQAQLFLIKNRATSLFATNINSAQDVYLFNYEQAKKKNCDVKKFMISPLSKIENILKKKTLKK